MLQVCHLRARKAFSRGHRSWVGGNLEGALKHLEVALAECPGLPGGLLTKARVLSEMGRPDEALRALDEYMPPSPGAGPSPRGVGPVFRAIILYDHRGGASAREALAPLKESNVLAAAFNRLLDLEEELESPPPDAQGGSHTASLPLAARWIAEVTGRVLAILEVSFFRSSPKEALDFHYEYLAPAPLPQDAETGWGSPLPVSFESQDAWNELVERAFRRRQYEIVDELCRPKAVPAKWLILKAVLYRAFSLMALGKDARALQILSREAKEEPIPADVDFLSGLCYARLGKTREAGWAFTRAARFEDMLADDIFQKVSRQLRLEWTFDEL